MCNNNMKSEQGIWLHGMRYRLLSHKNRFLKVALILHNSKVLINDLIDLCDRLAKLCKYEQYSRRQKIILKLSREVKKHMPIPERQEEDKKEKIEK